MSEEWREVAGHPGYEVSNLGRVRSWVQRGRWRGRLEAPTVLQPLPSNRRGHMQVCLGQGVRRMIAHLVLEAFVGPRPVAHDAEHVDGNRRNDSAANLRWVRTTWSLPTVADLTPVQYVR